MLRALDTVAVRRWAAGCVRTLEINRDAIDRINVYPVPDSDTGTNMLATMRAALDDLLRTPEHTELGAALAALARGALVGARGNSGVILSQMLRGFAEELSTVKDPGGAAVRAALARGARLATASVVDPVDGTFLTVLHAAALAAGSATGLAEVTAVAAKAAATALAATPSQLDVLARAGVVDAGGMGLVLLLEELAAVAGEVPVPTQTARVVPRDAAALRANREGGSPEYQYEVMYLLESDLVDPTPLRSTLAGLGDSVVVAGDGDGLWSVHVHCTDVGAAIEAGVELGRPRRITVVRFADQEAQATGRFVRERAVVAVAHGPELAELFRAEGAVVVAADPAPSAADLLAVLVGTRSATVTVLPNDAAFGAVVDQAVEQAVLTGQDVSVVRSVSPVQGLAALAVHDPDRGVRDDVLAMTEAAAATRRGELQIAEEESLTWVGTCARGDVLGLIDGEVVLIEPGPAEEALLPAGSALLDRLLGGGGELVTVLAGSVPDGLADSLAEFLRRRHPEVDTVIYRGNAVLQFGVE